MTERKILLLVDTSALIHRAYHAIPPLTTKDGKLVNAVYGVVSTLLSVEKEYTPTYIIAAYDVGKKTFRHKMYAKYKAHRRALPDDLVAQFDYVRKLIDAFGILGLEHEDFEADDIIGTVAREIVQKYDDIDVVIVTGDNDALQLVNERVRVRTFGRGLSDAKVYDIDAVQQKYHLLPSQLPEYKGLVGDSSDNIPGVSGIGHKTAIKLLTMYGSLEGIYEHIDEIKGAVRERLERDREQAFLSRDLGRIVTNVPLTYDIEDARAHLNTKKVRAFFRKMNFFSLIKRLPHDNDKSTVTAQADNATCTIIAPKDVEKTLVSFAQKTCVAVRVLHDTSAIRGVALSSAYNEACFIAWTLETRAYIERFFAHTKRHAVITTFDTKTLMHLLARHNIVLSPPYSDVMLQAYVIGAGSVITLARCAYEELGRELPQKQSQLSLMSDDDNAVLYVQQEATLIYDLACHYEKKIAAIAHTQKGDASIATVLKHMEIPLIAVLMRMERIGVPCEKEILEALSVELGKKIAACEEKIYKHAGTSFNINSPQQLATILFDTLSLPTQSIKKTKTGYSTAASELEKLRTTHPIIALIEEYRELTKLRNTYVDVLPKLIDEKGRIHTTFQQAVTATGRLSSTDPNLQNIPTRTEYSSTIRRAFAAPDGFVLVSADYSQIDLRCIAHISGDEKMIAAFQRGDDIHELTAAEVFGVPKEKVTKQQRRHAKALNFGLIYGMGAYGFAQSAGIDIEQARDFIAKYFERFRGVEKYMQEIVAFAKEHGFVETPFGRRRAIPEINATNQQLARSGERMAINMPVQGMAADIMKYAMIAVAKMLNETYSADTARMILQVHDEIICEVRKEVLRDIEEKISTIMENIVTLRVPLVVDVSHGATWANLA